MNDYFRKIGKSNGQAINALRIRDAVNRYIYAKNPGKLAACPSASHVERG